MKIEYKLIDLSYERIKEQTHSYLELKENSLKWSVRYISDNRKSDSDEALGWDEDVFHCYTIEVDRKYVRGVSMQWLSVTRVWLILVILDSVNDISIHRKRESEASELFEKINNYIHAV